MSRSSKIESEVKDRGIISVSKKESTSDPLRPIFRWAGSKKRVLPQLIKSAPKTYGKYIEPFAGSACLFLSLNPAKAAIGDINAELISAYEAIRQRPEYVWKLAKSIPRTKASYYRVRQKNPTKLGKYGRAARFAYLNRLCFNGLYRTNRAGSFNVPRGTRTGQFPSLSAYISIAEALKRVTLVHGDFEKTLEHVERGDFVYLDPPYASVTVKDRNEYGVGSFKPKDIPRLLKSLRRIHRKGARFLLSYSIAPDFLAQLPVNSGKRIQIQRSIASKTRFRKIVSEVLLTNDDLFA
jgi:DNA adenine methylase